MKRKIRLQGKILIALAAVLGIAGTTVGVLALTSPSGVKVDNFIGKDKKVVETWRSKNDVEKNQINYSYIYDEEKDKDIVLKQSVKKGDYLTSDEILKITVSKGADPDKEFELPDFTGKEEKEVKAWFTKNKFTSVTYTYEVDPEVEQGKFISMDHDTGSKVKRSDAITVKICTPLDADQVEVPDLSSMSKADIESWANTNRINVNFVERANDTIAEGEIISISVNKGDRLNPGDTITVEISSGKARDEEDRETPGQREDNNNAPAPSQVSGGEQTPSDSDDTGNSSGNSAENAGSQAQPVTYTVPSFTQRENTYLANMADDTTRIQFVSDKLSSACPNVNINVSVAHNQEFTGVGELDPGAGGTVTEGGTINCVIYIND